MRESLHGNKSALFSFCRDEARPSATMLQDANGWHTGNTREMDRLLRQAWDPIFRMYADGGEPQWGPFEERYRQYIRAHPFPEIGPLTAGDLRATLGKMRGTQGVGQPCIVSHP